MSELAELPTHVLEIIHNGLKDNEERKLVAQIMHNYYIRGLLWWDDEDDGFSRQGVTDSTIAVTELVVLTNCLRSLHDKTVSKS